MIVVHTADKVDLATLFHPPYSDNYRFTTPAQSLEFTCIHSPMSSLPRLIVITVRILNVQIRNDALVHGWVPKPQGRGIWSILLKLPR